MSSRTLRSLLAGISEAIDGGKLSEPRVPYKRVCGVSPAGASASTGQRRITCRRSSGVKRRRSRMSRNSSLMQVRVRGTRASSAVPISAATIVHGNSARGHGAGSPAIARSIPGCVQCLAPCLAYALPVANGGVCPSIRSLRSLLGEFGDDFESLDLCRASLGEESDVGAPAGQRCDQDGDDGGQHRERAEGRLA